MDSRQINSLAMDSRLAAKRILRASYELKIKSFRLAIEVLAETRRVPVQDSAVLIAEKMEHTGHGSMLVYAALADLLEQDVVS